MAKGWNRNRGWNNGWGSNRTSRNGNRDLKWVNHSTIETARRVLNAPIAGPRKATDEPDLTEEMIGMGHSTDETVQDNNQAATRVKVDS